MFGNESIASLQLEIRDLRQELENLKIRVLRQDKVVHDAVLEIHKKEFVYYRSPIDPDMNKTMPVQQVIEMILDHVGAEFVYEPETSKLVKKGER